MKVLAITPVHEQHVFCLACGKFALLPAPPEWRMVFDGWYCEWCAEDFVSRAPAEPESRLDPHTVALGVVVVVVCSMLLTVATLALMAWLR